MNPIAAFFLGFIIGWISLAGICCFIISGRPPFPKDHRHAHL